MSEELRECPFCGGTDLKKMQYLDLVGWMYWIECKRCYYVRAVSLADMDDAIRKWNTRPVEDALKAENERLKKALQEIWSISSDVYPYCIWEIADETLNNTDKKEKDSKDD